MKHEIGNFEETRIINSIGVWEYGIFPLCRIMEEEWNGITVAVSEDRSQNVEIQNLFHFFCINMYAVLIV